MLSDIESHDLMLGGNNSKREEREFNNFGRRHESPCYDISTNQNTITQAN